MSQTSTNTTTATKLSLRGEFPQTLALNLTHNEKLSPEAAGHLRHFHNLSIQPPGDWSFMGSIFPEQEWHDGLRYQLATMAYAAGLAHYHRLPAIRAPFKTLFKRLIAKMLHRDVWGYWYLTSQGGIACNPDLKQLRKPWADPVVRENIMYSGHLLLMTTMYAMLFDDDEYETPGSLTFVYDPVYYGLGTERYVYDRTTLQNAIMKEMEREGWLGVCCEPNVIFVICNQFPLVALRYDGVRKGSGSGEDVLRKYLDAWKAKGVEFDGESLGADLYMVQQDVVLPYGEIAMSAWAAIMFNSWNPKLSHALYQHMMAGYLTKKPSGRYNLNPKAVAETIRGAQVADHESSILAKQAWDAVKTEALAPALRPGSTHELMPTKPIFGCVIGYVSEVGPREHLDGLLKHADEIFSPRWNNGGLYYERCDDVVDENGEWTFCDPFTGNALIGYARLNVPDGQRKMYENPWTHESITTMPWVDGVGGFEDGVDFLRGMWDPEARAMIVTVKSWSGERKVRIVVKGLEEGWYGVYLDGELVGAWEAGEVEAEFVVGAERERDLVVVRGT